MLRCLDADAAVRPTAREIVDYLTDMKIPFWEELEPESAPEPDCWEASARPAEVQLTPRNSNLQLQHQGPPSQAPAPWRIDPGL